MFSPLPAALPSNRELSSLYRIAQIPQSQAALHDYFHEVSTILFESFSITCSALVLQEPQKDLLRVEGVYGLGKETHPIAFSSRKGTVGKVLESRTPMPIQNVSQEPLFEEIGKTMKRVEKIRPPLLCFPLVTDGQSIGALTITPLYGIRDEFVEDFAFLSVLSAILCPAIRNHQLKGENSLAKPGKSKANSNVLEDLVKEKLAEVLNKIDPDVESKARLGFLDDIIAVVERILITSALERVGYVQVAAARILGINRNTLRKKIKDLKIKCL